MTTRGRTLWVGFLLLIALVTGVVIGRGLDGPPADAESGGDEDQSAFAAAFTAS